jgi:hypothetical protein
MSNAATRVRNWDEACLEVRWVLGDGAILSLAANLGRAESGGFTPPPGELLFESRTEAAELLESGRLPGPATCWFLADGTDMTAADMTARLADGDAAG